MPDRSSAFTEALIVVLLWSSSPLFVKIALEDLAPYEISGLRYFGAFLLLVPILILRSRRALRRIEWRTWLGLGIMGILAYTLGNTALFWSLETLSATDLAFLLNVIPLMTLLLGAIFLGETPRPFQWLGFGLTIIGGFIFFGLEPFTTDTSAILLALLGGLALSIFGVMGRGYARVGKVDTVTLSAIPFAVGGGLLLLIFPISFEGIGRSTLIAMLWLTIINSAIAFLLWNHARKRLLAFESSIIGNLMPIGTALFAPFIIGETVSPNAWVGMLIALFGVILVGLK